MCHCKISTSADIAATGGLLCGLKSDKGLKEVKKQLIPNDDTPATAINSWLHGGLCQCNRCWGQDWVWEPSYFGVCNTAFWHVQ